MSTESVTLAAPGSLARELDLVGEDLLIEKCPSTGHRSP